MQGMVEMLVSGVLLGAVYGLGALGISLIFGVMRILNLAHGAFMVAGGVGAWVIMKYGGYGLMVSVPAVFCLTFLSGFLLCRWGLDRSGSGAEPVNDLGDLSDYLLVTLGFTLIVDDLVARWSSQGVFSLPLETTSILFFGIPISTFKVMLFGMVVMIFGAFSLVIRVTDFGRMIRACTQDREGAVLMGISYRKISTLVFAGGCALAGLAGNFYLMLYPLRAQMAIPLTIKALLIVVLGGMGRVFHTLTAAMLLGLVEVFAGFWGSTESQVMIPYVGMLAVLLLWPEGIGHVRIRETNLVKLRHREVTD